MKNSIAITFFFCAYGLAVAQNQTKYPDIPRIDVHTHAANDYVAIGNYLEMRKELKGKYGIDYAFWLNLSNRKNPIHNVDSVVMVSEGRSLAGFGDYSPHDGLEYQPEDLEDKMKEGFVGFKIWYGSKYRRLEDGQAGFPYVDDPNNEALLNRMEELELVAASMHIADPNGPFDNRTTWCPDPIEYWKMIRAFTNMIEKHPDLIIVGAHGLWLLCQDAQIDYLRYLLSTYPNLYVDLAATFQYQNMVNYENLRSFMIEYSDRILYATDAGSWDTGETDYMVEAYSRSFRILETDEIVEGSFFGQEPIKGLNLPKDVLENLYYRNALKIYPRLKDSMKALGYDIVN